MNERPRSEINVTPLVDVCLVLLIIFMVVTPMIVDRVQLPQTAKPDARKRDRQNQVELFAGFPQGTLWLENKQVEDTLLLTELTALKTRTPSKELVLLADSRLQVQDVWKAMRLANKAGFRSIGLLTQQMPASTAPAR